ncbi:hypothetical protein ZHAS_00021670 [Anopheles sinensis]|uniref:Uncharacterized protein n=1 Tax=Anopheles sinensis TaxID=74873 RepID=A0A084WT15_ANOSI|nr:hypothetical protein ZHAS_00021670 [Anopheles sinensis]
MLEIFVFCLGVTAVWRVVRTWKLSLASIAGAEFPWPFCQRIRPVFELYATNSGFG